MFCRFSTAVFLLQILGACIASVPVSSLVAAPQTSSAQRPGLIRDTDVADGVNPEPEVKNPDPLLCEKNINIGDFYYKKKNYAAAISRYLDAIEYQADSVRAYDSLGRAYEKNDEPGKAIAAYKQFIEKNPDSPKVADFQSKIAKLEKASR